MVKLIIVDEDRAGHMLAMEELLCDSVCFQSMLAFLMILFCYRRCQALHNYLICLTVIPMMFVLR